MANAGHLHRRGTQIPPQEHARPQPRRARNGHERRPRITLHMSTPADIAREAASAAMHRRTARGGTRAIGAAHTHLDTIPENSEPRPATKRSLSTPPSSSSPSAKRSRAGGVSGLQNNPEEDNDSRKVAPKVARRTCSLCCIDTPVNNTATLPCKHLCCRGCIDKLFAASVTYEALFPPRCCSRQSISLSLARPFLQPATLERYEKQAPELETPPHKRVYCSRPACSTWIPPTTFSGDVAVCPRPDCDTETCIKCKEEAHGETKCGEDEAARSLLALAEAKKWKRCPRCRRVVERIDGCDDMSCLCGAAFCYVCGVEWRSGDVEDACGCYDHYGSGDDEPGDAETHERSAEGSGESAKANEKGKARA